MNNKLIEKIENFSSSEWNLFIKAILVEDENYKWTTSLGDNCIVILMNIYRILNEHKKGLLTYFFDSCLYNLKTIDKINTNSRAIYGLIYIVHETKPVEQKNNIFQILIGNQLKGLKYGNSELEYLLVKAFILLENAKNTELKEWMFTQKLENNFIYLRPLYFSHILEFEKAFDDIKLILEGKIILDSNECFVFYNTLIDIFPNKIPISSFVQFLHRKKVSIINNMALNETLQKVIIFWENSNIFASLTYHLQDYFQKNDKNANLYPKYFEELINFDSEIGLLISEYYLNQEYNIPIYANKNDFLFQICNT